MESHKNHQQPLSDVNDEVIESNPNNLNPYHHGKKQLFLAGLIGIFLVIILFVAGYYLLLKPITPQEIKTANLQSITLAKDIKSLNSSQVYNLNLSGLTSKVLANPKEDIASQLNNQLSQIDQTLQKTQKEINILKKSPVLRNHQLKITFEKFETKWQKFDNFINQLNQSYKSVEPSLLSYFLIQTSLLVKVPNITNNPMNAISYLNQVESANKSALKTFQSVNVSNPNLKDMVHDSIKFINQSDSIIAQANQDRKTNNLTGLVSQAKLFLNLEVGYIAQIKLAGQNLKNQYDNLYPGSQFQVFQQDLKKLK